MYIHIHICYIHVYHELYEIYMNCMKYHELYEIYHFACTCNCMRSEATAILHRTSRL